MGRAGDGQLGVRGAPGRLPLRSGGCGGGPGFLGAATDERRVSERWRARAWPPKLASPTKKKWDLGADADRAAQAVFEEAVADGSYFAGPDFEWEPGEAEVDH